MEDKETGRLEAFSDGVFAVAITLLVLNIKPISDEVLKDGGFWNEFGRQLPALLAFVTSFFTIGIMWINHHRLFNHIKRTDTGLLLLNLLLLLVIVFIPYPTALLAQQYALNPEMHDAALLYLIAFGLAFVSVAASIIFLLLLALFFALPPRLPRSVQNS